MEGSSLNSYLDSPDTEGSAAHVLIVDDDEGLNNLARKSLKRNGFEASGVFSGAQALEVFPSAPFYTALLVDQKLPDMKGTELIQALHDKDWKPPFVAMTGHGDENVAVEMMKLGARDYLVKGFDLTDILPEIFTRVFREMHTERRLARAEEALRQSEGDKTIILESMSDLLVFYESPELRIKWTNRAAGDSVGREPEGLIGCFCYQIWGQREDPCPGCPVLECFESGCSVSKKEQRTPDGRVWEILAYPAHNQEGGLQGVVEVTREITEEKRKESALQDAEIEKQTILDHQLDNILLLNPDFKIMWANKAASDFAELSVAEMQGRYCFEFYNSLKEPCSDCPVVETFNNGEIRDREIQTPDGHTWEISVCPIRDNTGHITHALVVGKDVTEQKLNEERLLEAKEAAEAASRTKTAFLANMSHELRTPMNGLMGMLQLLEGSSLDEEQQDYVTTALQSGNRLVNLLSDILDVSRVEAGQINLKHRSFDFPELMRTVEQLFQPACEQKKIELHFHTDSAIPRNLIGDPSRLQQVLNNLVGNAVKYTQRGHVEVQACPLTPQQNGILRIFFSVSDTGMGIEDDKLSYLFQPFTQADEGYTRKFEGAGLGLTIVHRLVDMMGGSISVSSEVDTGTVFYFSLPFESTEREETGEKVTPEGEDIHEVSPKVLLAEDDRINQMSTVKVLEKNNCKVRAVETGKDALKELGKNEFDLVLMDIQMPVMDGVQATQAIRRGEAGEQNKNIPIIAITAYAMEGDKETFLESGMNDYLAKPVGMNSLMEMLRKVLQGARN